MRSFGRDCLRLPHRRTLDLQCFAGPLVLPHSLHFHRLSRARGFVDRIDDPHVGQPFVARWLGLAAFADALRKVDQLARKPLLRGLLRMMRAPAVAGGVGGLHEFLERGYGGLPKLCRMAFIVEINESLGPMDISFCRAATVMQSSYRATQPIQETGAVRIV